MVLASTRAYGATVAAAYSPRVRPGVPVSVPGPWGDLDAVTPGDFTVHSVPGLLAGHPDQPSYLVLDIDPPPGGPFGQAVAAAHLIRQALSDAGLAGAVKTSGSKGLHIYVPVQASGEEAAAATRAIATRAARLDPSLATTAFIKEDREGKVFLDSTRAFGATVAAAYSPRIRPGVPVSFPVRWEDIDSVTPGDFTVHSVLGMLDGHAAWAGELPAPQVLPPELVEEGRAIPVARVQAMHEGKRRKRAREAQ